MRILPQSRQAVTAPSRREPFLFLNLCKGGPNETPFCLVYPIGTKSSLLQEKNSLLVIDRPALAVRFICVGKALRKNDLADLFLVLLHDRGKLCVARKGHMNAVGDLISVLLTHGLDLADQLVDVALLDQLGGKSGIEHHRHTAVTDRLEACLLDHLDEKIVARKLCHGVAHGK